MRVFAIAVVCALSLGIAYGQATNSGDIRGTVTDSTGALVPDVTVTIVNVDTGITKVLTTNHDGLYDTSSIVVGTYSVTFEKQGFSRFERSGISLEVGTSTVNAVLKVGSTTELVTTISRAISSERYKRILRTAQTPSLACTTTTSAVQSVVRSQYRYLA
jgi:hypothetical protein